MSKSIRLKQHLVVELERLAVEEKRSLANMVEVLLEQALRMDEQPISVPLVVPGGSGSVSSTARVERRRSWFPPSSSPDDHFKPDPKGGR